MKLTLSCLLTMAVMLSLTTGCTETNSNADNHPKLEFVDGELIPAEACGTCHQDIYSFWKGSVHATSAQNDNFLETLQEVTSLAGEEKKALCLTCHAPSSVLTGNLDLDDPLNAEGIGCDFCHSLTGTDLAQTESPFVLEVSEVKFGPVKDASSTGHEVGYSEFHNDSRHCAGCHEYTTPNGVSLLTTYTEWEDYKEGGGTKSCQNCHMPLVMANVVDPKIKRVEHSFVNLHSMPGGHSRDQLTKSLRLKIMEMTKGEKGLAVKVQVTNEGAGHMVPTGSPSRKVILTVSVTAEGEEPVAEERVYQRMVADADGEPIRTDARLFLDSASVIGDTRIAPGEVRAEDFLLKVALEKNLEIRATLKYVFSPHDRPETATELSFFSETRRMMSSWTRY
ncbi:MAG: hypothetical protein JSU96_19945 [Acidobacteriota bacterium]|nr:MAG: hypothetical protein JSU96_19945 [Acidobacteriota bacterium]